MNAIHPSPRTLAINNLLMQARQRLVGADPVSALPLLQRAHVLGQPDFGCHLLVHWLMLRAAWSAHDAREVLGQLLRLALVPLGHLSGRLPKGNPGTSDVSAFAPQPISPELISLMDESN